MEEPPKGDLKKAVVEDNTYMRREGRSERREEGWEGEERGERKRRE